MDLWGGFSWGSLPSRPGSPLKSHEERLEAASNAVTKMAVVSPERHAGVGLMSPVSTLAGPLGGEISPITPEGDLILPTCPSSASAFWRSRSLLGPGNSPQPRGNNQMHAASIHPDSRNATPCPPVNLQNHFSLEPGFTIWNEGGIAKKESFPRLHLDTALLVGGSSEGLPEGPQTMSTSTGLEGPTSQCTTVSQDEFDRTFSFGPSSRSPSPQFPLDQPPRSVSPTLHEPLTHGVLDRSVSFAAWGAAAFREGQSETPPPSGQEEEGEGQNLDGAATLLEEASRTAIKGQESEGDGRGRSQEGLSSDDEGGVWNDCADEFVESEEEGLAPRATLAFGGWANRSFDLGEALRTERAQSAEGPAASPSVAKCVEGSKDVGRSGEATRVGGFHRRARGRDQAFGSWECSTPEFGRGASFGGEERGAGFSERRTAGAGAALLCNEDDLLCEEDEEVSDRQQEGSNSLRDSCKGMRKIAEGDVWARQAESLLQIGLGSGPLVGLGRKAVSDSGLESRGQTDLMDTTGGAKSGSVGVKRSESDAELDAGDTSGVAQSANVRTPEKSPTKRTKAVGLGMSLDCWLPFKQLVGETGVIAAALEQRDGLLSGGVNTPGVPTGQLAGEREGLLSRGLGLGNEAQAQLRGEKRGSFGGGSDVTSEAMGQSVGGSSGMGTSEESPTRMELAADQQMDAVDEYAVRGTEVTSQRAERGAGTAVRLSLWGSPPAANLVPAVAVYGLDDSPPARERRPSIDVPPSPSPKPRVSITQNNSGRAGGPLSPGAKNRQAAGLKKAQGLIGQEGLQGVLPPRKPPRAKQWAVKNGMKSLETRTGEGSLGVIRKRRGFGALQLPAGGEASLPGVFSPRDNFSGGLSPRERGVDREALIRSRVRKLTAEEKTARFPLYSPWRGAAGATLPTGGDDVSMRAGDVSDDVSRRHSDPSSSNSSSSFQIRSNARLVRNASDARSNFPASPGMPGGGPPLAPMPEDSEGGSEGSKHSYSGAVVGAFGGGGDMESPETPQVQTIPEEGEQECPEAPTARQSRMTRQGSLMETKLLMTTALKRTQSFFLFDKHFEFLKVIGRGSYSTVYQARDRRSGGLCAIKKSKREFKGRDDRERYLHEIESVACLSEHPNVVKYYRGWQQEGHFFIQMELCEGGNLKDWTASQTTPLEEDRIWDWVRQIASGLQYLHSKCVLHLDIKPENIFLDSGGTLKIGDFGLAVLRRQWEWEEGDGAYVAPELLREHEPGPEADMYSFGAMIFEWATGRQLPRSGPERQGHVDLPDRSDALARLVRSLLSGRPESRPSAEEVLAMGL